MISRRLSSLFLFLAFVAAGVQAAPSLFGHFRVPKSPAEIEAEVVAQTREEFLTDSLLNSIEVDSITREVYTQFTPRLDTPRVLSGFGDIQYNNIDISWPGYGAKAGVIYSVNDSVSEIIYPVRLSEQDLDPIPEWFKKSLRFQNQIQDAQLNMMMSNPGMIEYADWNLPVSPRLPEEDYSFRAFLRKMNLPELPADPVILPETEQKRKNWLHYFNVMLQFSEAYVSSNWYQGGNSSISGLFGFTWNVDLNQNFYPKVLFQSSLQYKLAVNSNPKGSLHKYNTSQDLFQYNLKTGLKAFNHWFYSLNLLFQTQLFNAYPDDSLQRKSGILSPGTFNLGLGMTYTLAKNNLNLTASISPLAYNLKTCVANDIDHLQFNIEPNRHTVSEVGSSAEINLTWKFSDNISWKSRLFLFSDYSYFLADWENTLNFQINKVLSTQLFLHPRFDSSTEDLTKWGHWMLHEILSFGISYTFQTPK